MNFTKEDLKDTKVITLNNNVIPKEDIENNNKIAFIVCTSDEKVLQQTLNAIIKIQKEYKNKDFSVFISSSYEKLHKLTNGKL